MALMALPPRRITDSQEVIRRFAHQAEIGIKRIWCNHDLTPPPDADWEHSGITRVPFLVICDSGSFTVTVREFGERRRVRLTAGCAVLHGEGAYAWHHHTRPSGMLNATFDSDHLLLGAGRCLRAADLDDPEDFLPMRTLVLQPPPAEPCGSLARAILACPATDSARRMALVQAVLWQLAASAASDATTADDGAHAIRAWIRQRACRSGIGRVAVAQAFKISPTHVSRLLASSGGVAAEIERTRLQHVEDHLRSDPGMDLSTIAKACGFTDASHLVRRFRIARGVTPAAWRRSHGGSALG